jgi:Lrp/AsnC family leucine-responsive transcriptional regulator
MVFEKSIVTMPEIVSCHLVSGEADCFLEVVVPDLEHYQQFLVGRLRTRSASGPN